MDGNWVISDFKAYFLMGNISDFKAKPCERGACYLVKLSSLPLGNVHNPTAQENYIARDMAAHCSKF